MLLLLAAALAAAEKRALTNADIIKMVKAELPDSTILLAIEGSPAAFDTGVDALIELKAAGVGTNVLEAMLARQVPAPAAAERATTVGTAVDVRGRALPTAYGFYVAAGDKYVPLPRVPVDTVFGLIVGGNTDRGMAVDGIKAGTALPSLPEREVDFIAYEHGLNPSDLRLARLMHVTNMSARQFNIIGTDAAFFENVYGVPPHRLIDVDLLRAAEHVPMRIEPVPDRPNMFRLTPSGPMIRGAAYAVYVGDAMHESDTVFTATVGRSPTSAIAFRTVLQTPEEAAQARRREETHRARVEALLARPVTGPGADDRAFSDKKTGLAIRYPAAFALREAERPTIAYLDGPAGSGGPATIRVVCTPTALLNRNPPLNVVSQQWSGEMFGGLRDLTIVGPLPMKLAGFDAHLFVGRGQQSGKTLERAAVIAVGRQRLLAIVLDGSPEAFAEQWDTYRRIMESCSLK